MNICLTAVTEVEGIGPATALALQAVGVDYVVDFLLHTPLRLSQSTNFSVEQCEAWRTTALLFELKGMNNQLAEALIEIGIKDTEHLSLLPLNELSSLLTTALADDAVEEMPVPETLAALQVQAAAAFYGKLLQGKVADAAGLPLADVLVTIGEYSTTTNQKGVWRISGMRLPDRVNLYINKAGYRSVVLEDVVPESDIFSLNLLTQTLSPGVDDPVWVDEFEGDDIGPATHYAVESVFLDEGDLREGDLFKVTFLYKNGDVRFTSMYAAKRNEVIQVFAFRVPATSVDTIPNMYSYWEYKAGKMKPSSVTDATLLIRKALFKARKRRSGPGRVLTFNEVMGTASISLSSSPIQVFR